MIIGMSETIKTVSINFARPHFHILLLSANVFLLFYMILKNSFFFLKKTCFYFQS